MRWETLRADAFKTEKLHAFIDSIADILSEPQTREFSKWPVLGEWVWRETDGYAERDTYQKEVDYLKKFLTERWTWMDVELAKVNRPASILGLFDQNEVSIFPNPARNRLTFKGNKKGASNVSVWIYDNSGKLMQRPLLVNQDDKNATVTCELGNSYEPGLYLYQLFMDGELMASGKFIKVD